MFELQAVTRPVLRTVRAALLVAGACVTLSAQGLPGSKMYAVQGQKPKLVEVSSDLEEDSPGAVSEGRRPATVAIPYSEIPKVEYERTAHRRSKAVVLVSGLVLRSKDKKHWLAVFRGEEETVFQLSKGNCTGIIDSVEASTGKDVKVVVRRG